MIHVDCHLSGGSVFLCGQTVTCQISVSCTHPDGATSDNIAWISAQIQCFCQVNSQLVRSSGEVNDPVMSPAVMATGTSYCPDRGEKGRVILATAPRILACDLCVNSDEMSTFNYSQKLPDNIPPSYRGRNVCFLYKITVGVQKLGGAIKLLRVPIRVLPVPTQLLHQFNISGATQHSDSIGPVSPFLLDDDNDGDGDTVSSLVHVLQHLTAKRTSHMFNITNQHGAVVRLCIYRVMYRLGDEVIGHLDFTNCSVPCVEYLVRLETVEEVNELYRQTDKQQAHVQQITKCHDVCVDTKWSSLSLHVPLHVTPSFDHQLMSLKWRLHFEFVTQSSPKSHHQQHLSHGVSRKDHSAWDAPDSVTVETMEWNLDISVHSTTPQHVNKTLHINNSQHSVSI